MGNWTLPANITGVKDMLLWTNQIAGTDYALGIFFLFFTYILPLLYLISIGQDKTESAILAGVISFVVMFFLSLQALVPQPLVLSVLVVTAFLTVVHFAKK